MRPRGSWERNFAAGFGFIPMDIRLTGLTLAAPQSIG
jgi:hypothetical protein